MARTRPYASPVTTESPTRVLAAQDGGNRTAAAVQPTLDHDPLRVLVGVCPQVERRVGDEDDRLEEVLDPEVLLGGDVDEHAVAAILLGYQAVLGELTAHLARGRRLPCRSC